MAQRVTPAQVREIIYMDADVSLVAFIAQAHILTNRVQAKDTDGLLDDGGLMAIERLLAAHFAAHHHKNQQYSSKTTGRASGSYQGRTEMGLRSTLYGQDAIDLDPTGTLLEIADGGAKTTSVIWGGTDYRNAPPRGDST